MRGYLIFSALLCGLFLTAGIRGYSYTSFLHPTHWSPAGHGVHK